LLLIFSLIAGLEQVRLRPLIFALVALFVEMLIMTKLAYVRYENDDKVCGCTSTTFYRYSLFDVQAK
jgi:hypothetical protein